MLSENFLQIQPHITFFSLRWKSFSDTVFGNTDSFQSIKTDSVIETIEAKFIEMIIPVHIEKEMTNINPQTILRRTETIHAGEIQ